MELLVSWPEEFPVKICPLLKASWQVVSEPPLTRPLTTLFEALLQLMLIHMHRPAGYSIKKRFRAAETTQYEPAGREPSTGLCQSKKIEIQLNKQHLDFFK
jgi:hypothetical protein